MQAQADTHTHVYKFISELTAILNARRQSHTDVQMRCIDTCCDDFASLTWFSYKSHVADTYKYNQAPNSLSFPLPLSHFGSP